ncbi:hypothetical protein MHUMG1_04272 [Metarhizium humberi]|uniref:Uncharacterized protein n=1 Tax=Metarhizium humberi TaxID=2596975 RepID=A0A9P8MBZ8_9HYPO|nr:hypothetical protein MHUMG1_04272 [Metarhizium humberi]
MAVRATKTPGGEWIYGAIKEALLLAPTDQHGKIKLKLKVHWESRGIQIRESIPPREIDETTTSIGKTPEKPKRTCQDYVAKTWPKTGADVQEALMEFLDCQHSLGSDNLSYLSYKMDLNWVEQYAQYTAEIGGPLERVAAITEQLAWITATFRNSNFSTQGPCKVGFSWWTKERDEVHAEIKPLPLDPSPEPNSEKSIHAANSPQYVFEYNSEDELFLQPMKEDEDDSEAELFLQPEKEDEDYSEIVLSLRPKKEDEENKEQSRSALRRWAKKLFGGCWS